jgi:hypothetical protein
MRSTLFFLTAFFLASCSYTLEPNDFKTRYEESDGLETATYDEAMLWWENIDKASPYLSIANVGTTDAGEPLHLIVISPTKNFLPKKLHEKERTIMLINNGIHPGESDGIDASMLFARDLLSDSDFESKYENTVFLIIPIYNVGGALNRNCCTRANQNGPVEYGFRGNARNLDLNRDFIKCDSKNAKAFNGLFNQWNPDIYLETHVSNGADYQYTMTYLFSHPDKLTPALSEFTKNDMIPSLVTSMKDADEEMIPYVNVFGTTPDSGYYSFYDSPRYSTGYTALHNSIGLLTETHMLKPYAQRVKATHTFIHQLAAFVNTNGKVIKNARTKATEQTLAQNEFILDWEEDKEHFDMLSFNGYDAYYDTSAVTGLPQLYYDQSKPWTKDIKHYNRLKATKHVTAPKYYLLPAGWSNAVELMKLNEVEMTMLEKDTLMDVVAYEIEDYKTSETPYEGHYLHKNTQVARQNWSKQIRANEYYLIDVNQIKKRYIIETLEPTGPDALFAWNFFDEILQQKEWFSTYVFDKEAADMLTNDAALKTAFEEMKKDSSFAQDRFKQLYYLYRNSDHYEDQRHMIYPVLRAE